MTLHTLYSLGYIARTLPDVAALVEQLGAVLVDTRFAPRSKMPEWNQGPLVKALGERYVWMGKTLGNRNYANGREIELAAPEQAIAPIRALLEVQPVILLCMCMDVDLCHRRVAAEYLSERIGCVVEHLPPPERKRKEAPVAVAPMEPLPFTLRPEGKATRLVMSDGRTGLFKEVRDAQSEGERLAAIPAVGRQINRQSSSSAATDQ